MLQVWKEALGPGTFWVENLGKDGKVLRYPVEFSAGDVANIFAESKAMVAGGVPVPVPFEHQRVGPRPMGPEHFAERKYDLVKHNSGFVGDYRMNAAGRLEARVDVDDPSISEDQLTNRIKFVSPWISPEVMDGKGRVWGKGKGAITHLALTPTPRFLDQKPFGAQEKALLKAGKGAGLGAPKSLATALSMSGGLAFAMDDQPPPVDDMADEPGDKPETDTEPPTATPSETPETGGKPDDAIIQECAEDLKELGVEVPVGGTLREFVEHICTAIKTHKATKALASTEGGEQPPEAPVMPHEEEPQVVAMSQLRDQNAALQRENLQLRGRMAKNELARAKHRIKKLVEFGYASPADGTAWTNELEAKAMSLAGPDQGPLATVFTQMEFAEKVAKDRGWKPGPYALEGDKTAALGKKRKQVALSAAGGEVEPPAGLWGPNDNGQDAPEPGVMDKLTGGTWKPPEAKE